MKYLATFEREAKLALDAEEYISIVLFYSLAMKEYVSNFTCTDLNAMYFVLFSFK